MAQVYGFSHQSGGTVVATSTVGSGAAITIYLPRKHAALVKAVAAPAMQPMVPGQGTILIVEDNEEVANVTASLVEQLGYRTLRAGNAMHALNRLRRDRFTERYLSREVSIQRSGAIPTANEYRQQAQECLELAKKATDLYAIQAMMELADEFNKAADELERKSFPQVA